MLSSPRRDARRLRLQMPLMAERAARGAIVAKISGSAREAADRFSSTEWPRPASLAADYYSPTLVLAVRAGPKPALTVVNLTRAQAVTGWRAERNSGLTWASRMLFPDGS
jgi:hypothetical protein